MRQNILILGHNYVSHFIDIFNQYAHLFDKEKYHVTVVYLTGAADSAVKERTHAHEVIFLNLSKKNIRTLKIKAIKKVYHLCKEKNFQMVICHRYKPVYIMMWVALFVHIPQLVFVMHELKTMSSFSRQMLIACLARKNMLFAGVSNAVCEDMRKDLWCVPKKRIVTLYNAIDIELMEPNLLSREEARKELKLSDNDFVFGNLARLVPNKDHTTLIHAFSFIKATSPHAKLIILGSGELELQLKDEVIAHGLEDSIFFSGFIANGYRYMRAFDCFVLSSAQEAFGRVLIEAMIAKLPIIATKVHGIPEVMGQIGKLVEAKNPMLLSQAMQEIYDLPTSEREKQGNDAYHHVSDQFSIPAFRQQFWSLINEYL